MASICIVILPGNIGIFFFKLGVSTRNWIDSAENRNYWRVDVNAALNLRVS